MKLLRLLEAIILLIITLLKIAFTRVFLGKKKKNIILLILLLPTLGLFLLKFLP